MTMTRKGKYRYTDTDADIATEVVRYSACNADVATRFAQALCPCGSTTFGLWSDEDEGVAKRICDDCAAEVFMGDGAAYASGATLEDHACICPGDRFAIVCGVALYAGSEEVKWLYIGCRCRTCDLVGVFADWKCEGGDATDFLARV